MVISNSYGLYIKQPTIGTNKVAAFFGGYVGINMLAPQYWLDTLGIGRFATLDSTPNQLIVESQNAYTNAQIKIFQL